MVAARCFTPRVLGDLDLSNHLYSAVGRVGYGTRASQDSMGSVLGIEGVGFAVPSAQPAIRTGDFHDLVSVTADVGGHGRSVRTGSFDAEGTDFAKILRPLQ